MRGPRQFCDVAVAGLKLAKKGIGAANASEECAGQHGPSDFNAAASIGEVKQTFFEFDFGNVLAQKNGTCRKILAHPAHSLAYAERFGMGHPTHVTVNSLTNSVVGRYLPTAAFERPAAFERHEALA